MRKKRNVDVQIQWKEDLTEVAFDIISLDGVPLSGQDLIDMVAEAILLKYNNYDLDSPPELDG